MALGVAGLLGLIILVYLQKIGGKWETSGSTAWLKVIACGLGVFALGYGIFLTNRNVSIGVTTGIGNRIAIAAAIGVALSLVGAFGWISDIWTSIRTRRLCFCALVTVFCMSGFLINNGVASFWIAAYEALSPRSTRLAGNMGGRGHHCSERLAYQLCSWSPPLVSAPLAQPSACASGSTASAQSPCVNVQLFCGARSQRAASRLISTPDAVRLPSFSNFQLTARGGSGFRQKMVTAIRFSQSIFIPGFPIWLL